MQNLPKRESLIERQSCRYAEKQGWWQVKIEKASVRGFPDRLFIKNGKTIYIEFKNEKGRLSDEQVRIIGQMREQGAEVYIISSLEAAREVFG